MDFVSWEQDRAALLAIRIEVFVHEQQVPIELEEDSADPLSEHLLATHSGELIGTARLLPDGHIGRMAVRKHWRKQGVGSQIMRTLIERAREKGLTQVQLNAQCAAEHFYQRHGFSAHGPVFDEAGIPHRHMILDL